MKKVTREELKSLIRSGADVSQVDVSNVTDMSWMFSNSSNQSDLSGWDVSSVTDMSYMFSNSSNQSDLSGWDVSSVTDMSGMFSNSSNQSDLSGWDVSSVTDMSGMFYRSNISPSIFYKWDCGIVLVDGIISKLVHERDGILVVKTGGERQYIVTDGSGNYAHGRSLREANEDLLFKTSERNTSNYEGLTVDSELDHVEAMLCYRVITGACLSGISHFVNSVLGEKRKEKYMVSEIIELTNGQYGSEKFADFFS